MNQEIKSKLSKQAISILVIIVLLVAVFSYAFYKYNDYDNDQKQKIDANINETYQKIKVEKILSKTAVEDISLSAITEPLDETKISAKTSGRMAIMYVNEGDFVYTGQIVAQLEDDQSLVANYNTAFNNYQIAQKNLENIIFSTQKDIESTEIGISTAEKNLKNSLDKSTNDLSNAYENAKLKSDSALLTINNSLENVKNILDDHATGHYNNYYQYFPTSNSQSFNDLMNSYVVARSEYSKTLDYYNSIKYETSRAEIDEMLIKIDDISNKTSLALDDMRIILSYAITSSNFTVAQLGVAKNSIYSAQAVIDGSSSNIKTIK
ncbi:MAG: biotin/lipoyl-binding protein [Patescibacteria group bacterium]|nr:biotin/lipoyl-binding protein [Patescibacteria group bacterium]